jgi:hypothetical protein
VIISQKDKFNVCFQKKSQYEKKKTKTSAFFDRKLKKTSLSLLKSPKALEALETETVRLLTINVSKSLSLGVLISNIVRVLVQFLGKCVTYAVVSHIILY